MLRYYIDIYLELMQNYNQMLDPQKTPHTSPWRASYGVSFVNICQKIIRALHCIFSCFLKIIHHNKGYYIIFNATYRWSKASWRSSALWWRGVWRRGDSTCGTRGSMTNVILETAERVSRLEWWHISIVASQSTLIDQQLDQANNKWNIKVPHFWPLWWESTGDCGFPS